MLEGVSKRKKQQRKGSESFSLGRKGSPISSLIGSAQKKKEGTPPLSREAASEEGGQSPGSSDECTGEGGSMK